MFEQKYFNRKAPLAAAAATAMASVTIEGLETRSHLSASVVITAGTPTPKVFQGEVVQADFGVPADAGISATGWSVNWGDGSTSRLSANRSHATHRYAATGLFSATVAATAPHTTPASLSFKIVNAAPDVAITDAPVAGVEGTAIALGSSVNDAGDPADRVYGWTVYRDGKHFVVPDNTDITSSHFSFTPTNDGAYVARLTVLDGQGGIKTTQTAPVVVANAAPTGTITGTPHRTVDDGRTVYLAASASDPGARDTLTYAWSITQNGSPLELDRPATRTQALAGLADGTYVAACIVTDDSGAQTALTPVTFDVATTLPPTTASIGGVSPVGEEGTAVNAYATAFGPAASSDDTYVWSVTKNGQPFALPAGVVTTDSSFTFTPDDDGEYVIRAVASDDNGIFGNAALAITVANAPPAVTVSGEPGSTIDEGAGVHLTTAVTDLGTLDQHGFAWSITRDGQAWTPPQGTVLDGAGLLFTPTDNGTYVATVAVTDFNGGQGLASSQAIVVRNVTPVATISGEPATPDEGTPITLGSQVTDAGAADTESYLWSVTKNGQPYAMASTVDLSSESFTFVPNDNGTYVATLVVTDKDGGQDTTQSTAIAVANVAPTGSVSGVDTANEGDAIAISAYGADVGTADTLSYQWHATRNGQTVTLGGSAAVNGELDYTPALPGDYVFSVTIRDDDGGATSIDHAVSVANVTPLVAVAGPGANAGQGDTLTYSGLVTDPGSETLSYTWAVKRNGTAYALQNDVITDGPALSFTAMDGGNYFAYLTVTDGVGGLATASSGITSVASVLQA